MTSSSSNSSGVDSDAGVDRNIARNYTPRTADPVTPKAKRTGVTNSKNVHDNKSKSKSTPMRLNSIAMASTMFVRAQQKEVAHELKGNTVAAKDSRFVDEIYSTVSTDDEISTYLKQTKYYQNGKWHKLPGQTAAEKDLYPPLTAICNDILRSCPNSSSEATSRRYMDTHKKRVKHIEGEETKMFTSPDLFITIGGRDPHFPCDPSVTAAESQPEVRDEADEDDERAGGGKDGDDKTDGVNKDGDDETDGGDKDEGDNADDDNYDDDRDEDNGADTEYVDDKRAKRGKAGYAPSYQEALTFADAKPEKKMGGIQQQCTQLAVYARYELRCARVLQSSDHALTILVPGKSLMHNPIAISSEPPPSVREPHVYSTSIAVVSNTPLYSTFITNQKHLFDLFLASLPQIPLSLASITASYGTTA